MSSLQNVLPEAGSTAPRRVLLLAHSDFAEPMVCYLRRLGFDVTIPPLEQHTAEGCAALLFPGKPHARKPSENRPWLFPRRIKGVPQRTDAGPPAFFAWGAFDAVVIQDLWPGAEDNRLIPLGCTVVTTDYYVRGNFNQPKIVIVTDPAFYGLMRKSSMPFEETLRSAFDRNEQIIFVPVVGETASPKSMESIGAAVQRKGGGAKDDRSGKDRRRDSRDGDAPVQTSAMAVLSSALAKYISSRAHVVVIDDAASTVSAIAAQFCSRVDTDAKDRVHVADVTAGTVASHSSFDEVQKNCEAIIEQARESNELLLIVTDILFDAVEWDGERKTGVDLIDALSAARRDRHSKIGIVGLTGIVSPLVMTSAFQRGADAVVNKSAAGSAAALHHANRVDPFVLYKLLLTLGSLCFQHEFLYAKRHAADGSAHDQSAEMRRILPSHAVSPHLTAEWEATQYLLESQATYGTTSRAAQRAIRRIREQYD
jgi:CheY-like chemotaxis protein